MGVIASVSWYVKELMGDHDYARYCAHLQRHHPGAEPPTEKEYWRRRWEREARSPGSRCC